MSRTIRIRKPNPPASEAKHSVLIPDSLREFLRRHNGGKPESHLLDLPEASNEIGFETFFSLSEMEEVKSYFAGEDRIPGESWPIAEDGGGNYLLVYLAGPLFGQIDYWDHDMEDGDPDFGGPLFKLADDFAEFWAALEPFNVEQFLLEHEAKTRRGNSPPG